MLFEKEENHVLFCCYYIYSLANDYFSYFSKETEKYKLKCFSSKTIIIRFSSNILRKHMFYLLYESFDIGLLNILSTQFFVCLFVCLVF